jgi:AcrR family transcriptional regulator
MKIEFYKPFLIYYIIIMGKRKDKKALILDAMEKIIGDGKAADCSVDEIAKVAGIGKGSIYYYYRSKREIEMDLYLRVFSSFIEKCESIPKTKAKALEKLKALFKTYYSQTLDLTIDNYLHLPQNMDMHQKVLTLLVSSMSPILSEILVQGIEEGIFECDMPDQYANLYVGIFAFMFDPGIFELTAEETFHKLTAFAELMERGLKAKKGCLSFVQDKDFLLSLKAGSESDFHLSNA